MANLEKSLKCSEKEVVTSYMPSRNPNDLKGQNIGKSIQLDFYHLIPGLACLVHLVYSKKGYRPIRDFYFLYLYHVAKERWNILISSLVRLRLREEVDVLKHLSQTALSSHSADGRHPNVLAYIDSWEEDEALYIRTELCESGNLARFLWEYGRVFPRLDEARVWKVIVDLSNVSITI